MTAQKLAHKTDSDNSGHFQFSSSKSEPKSEPIVKKQAVPLKKASEVNEKKDVKAETKKALAKGKDKGGKQGQKGFLGIGKIVNWL